MPDDYGLAALRVPPQYGGALRPVPQALLDRLAEQEVAEHFNRLLAERVQRRHGFGPNAPHDPRRFNDPFEAAMAAYPEFKKAGLGPRLMTVTLDDLVRRYGRNIPEGSVIGDVEVPLRYDGYPPPSVSGRVRWEDTVPAKLLRGPSWLPEHIQGPMSHLGESLNPTYERDVHDRLAQRVQRQHGVSDDPWETAARRRRQATVGERVASSWIGESIKDSAQGMHQFGRAAAGEDIPLEEAVRGMTQAAGLVMAATSAAPAGTLGTGPVRPGPGSVIPFTNPNHQRVLRVGAERLRPFPDKYLTERLSDPAAKLARRFDPNDRAIELSDPPSKPARDFTADYQMGSRGQGDLVRDMDNEVLGPGKIAGRRTWGGPDEGFTRRDIIEVGRQIFGPLIYKAAPPSAFPPEIIGSLVIHPKSRPSHQARLLSGMEMDREDRALRHLLGHAFDDLTGFSKALKRGLLDPRIERELRQIYGDLRVPVSSHGKDANVPTKTRPEDFGYWGDQVPQQYGAEAFRAYMTDPNFMKSVAPLTAQLMRRLVREHPELSRIVRLNALAGMTAAPLLDLDPAAAQESGDNIIDGNRIETKRKPGLSRLSIPPEYYDLP
jgi:hypothetical protein